MWTRCRVNTRGTKSCDDVNVGAERERGKEKEEEDFHLFSMSAQIFRFVLCFVLFYFGKCFQRERNVILSPAHFFSSFDSAVRINRVTT